MAENGVALDIQHLTKRFGRLEAVVDLTLRIRRGEIYAFLGPNGAGKTTTLRTVAGLLQPDSGEVRILGHQVLPDALGFRKLMAFVPDRPFLYEKLTAWEYMEFLASVHGLTDWEKRADEHLARFSLGPWKHQLIEGFSHGMRQKTVLSGALLHRPRLLLVDEPMVGLDPRSARIVKDLFRSLAGDGVCLFLSTHSLDVAAELADRIGILNRGRLIAEGSFPELQAQARQPESSLEQIFLTLTEEEGPGSAPADGKGAP
jgi:ABC-2 type transport system ATP-binding protein